MLIVFLQKIDKELVVRRVSATTLEEAYKKASKEFSCSIVDLDITIVQNHSSGFMGLFKKDAIIEINNKAIESNSNLLNIDRDKTVKEITESLERLLKSSCYELSVKEVRIDQNEVYIYIDGSDAALMIGKEGYRYKAISYLLHNWIKIKYNLSISLEIAQFLQNQKDSMDRYLMSVKQRVKEFGRAQTKPLDGILVKLALESLRAEYPNMYVALKSLKDGKKVVVVNKMVDRKK
jgi:spoIIIJ-associated protein